MNTQLEEQVKDLATQLRIIQPEQGAVALQEAYHQLRSAFGRLLFEVKRSPADHYAWLLMDQDAATALDRLTAVHLAWQESNRAAALWQAYKKEVDGFRWLIDTALLCGS